MEKSALIHKLNWFYSLELNQVQLYTEQSRQTNDLYLQKTLQRVAQIEQSHVDNLREQIIVLGGKPTVLGEAVAPLSGKAAGFITGKTGLISMLKANIDLEEKAMKDYKDFLVRAGGDQALFDLLWSNLIDEDIHTAWFLNKVRELEELESAPV
ncbi:MAG: ferritin-like domain-containing protein [Bacillota bacterium]|nr:ferritin-like domain-containing protein [Bacillota bacterium]MDW7683541.1 ferritin-like domain-containing protein [Bacillota bacterium]